MCAMAPNTSEHPECTELLRIPQREVRAEERAREAVNRSDRGKRMGGYSSSNNSSRGTPYALAIFVTVGM